MFKFEFSKKAALHNDHLLQHHDYDLTSAHKHQQHSPLKPGSEYKAVDIQQQLCQRQPHWELLQQYLTDGVD